MAAKTLASTWKQYEKQIPNFFDDSKDIEKVINSLNSIAQKANNAKIASAIGKLFFHDYEDFKDKNVQFYFHREEPDDYPHWPTEYDAETETIYINPVGIFQFQEDCSTAAELLTTPRVRKSFLRYRYFAFLTELKKLPSKIIMFLLALQQVALVQKIADVETKHGVEEADGEDYLTLLWAFKELERFLLHNNGLDLRSEFKISWYESDWSMGL